MTDVTATTGPGHEAADDAFLRQAGRSFLVSLYAALRSLKLYPVENAAVQRSLDDLEHAAGSLLTREGEIEIRVSGDFLFVNGTRLRLELDNYASFSHVQNLIRAFDIGLLVVHAGIQRREWQAFLSIVLSLAGQGTPEDRFLELAERMTRAEITNLVVQEGQAGDVEDERAAREMAKRAYNHGVAVTKEVVNSVRLGRTTNLKKVKRAVQMIVDQVLTNETSIIGLTTLRDYDEYTFTHSVNVCIFAVALGRKMGLGKLHLYDLGLTALLHDVGKARVPIEVLNKVDGLTDDEWRMLQTHTWRGALTLFGLRAYDEIPYRSILVAHEHHMKTDLTGYPRSIRPRSLGILSRLVAVADGFDAATSRRAYQTIPIEPDEVLREMWENPRRGYDPMIVKALINLIGVYPVGTCVILDTFEVGVVNAANPDPQYLNRPIVTLVIDPNGAILPPPGVTVDLSERNDDGSFERSIVKVTNPDRYGLDVGAYFV
jgi:HD-GYP domain-containing protein (c-di-GMP phosphodiesterase class II)